MRITLFTDGISPYVMGGMQRHSRLISEYLAREGVQVDIFHPVRTEDRFSEEEIRNSFSTQARDKISVKLVPYKDEGRLPGHYLRAQRALSNAYLQEYLKAPASDFIYTKGFTGWELLKKRRKSGVTTPVGVKFHGMNMFQKQANFRGELEKYLFRGPVRWIMKHSDAVFSYGGKITDIIATQGIPRDKIVSIPTGVESGWLLNKAKPLHNRPPRFLFVGRYDRVKGLPELYEAIGQLPASSAEFHFAGPIPDSQQLKAANVVYHGAVTRQDLLMEVYDQCDFLVCPSISEGMPNVVLEAMSRGLPVLATDVGAVNILVDHSTGMLIKSPEPASILKGLRDLIGWSEHRYCQASETCSMRIAEQFIWTKIAQYYVSSLRKLVISKQ